MSWAMASDRLTIRQNGQAFGHSSLTRKRKAQTHRRGTLFIFNNVHAFGNPQPVAANWYFPKFILLSEYLWCLA
jgi:hypothetical protein